MNTTLAIGTTLVPIVAIALLLDRFLTSEVSTALRIASSLAGGAFLQSLIVMGLGHANLLRSGVFDAELVAALALIIASHRRLIRWVLGIRRALPDVRRVALPVAGIFVLYVLVVINAQRAAVGGDEKDYKWASPLAWAHAHHFLFVHARLSNGLYATEFLAVPAATRNVVLAARLLQLIAVAVIAGAVWSAARRLSADGVWAVILAVSSPVIALGATRAGSDLWAAAFATCAAAWIMETRITARSAIVVATLLAAACATKVFMAIVAVTLVTVWIVLDRRLSARTSPAADRQAHGQYRVSIAALWPLLVIPAAIVIASGLHTHTITGSYIQQAQNLSHNGSDALATGRAAGRIPTISDIAMLPIVPVLVGVQSGEPYGTRTGIGITLALGLAAAGLIAAKGEWRRRIIIPCALGVATFVILAPVFIKTRFLLTSFLMWVVAGVGAMGWVAATRPKSEYRFVVGLMTVAVLVDIANSSQLLAKII